MMKKVTAEFIGTFWLVLGGCGSAVLAAAFPQVGIGLLGVALAFGLTVLTIVYSLGHISGAHLNPAVSIGLWMGGRFSIKELFPYILAQILGGIGAAAVLYVISTGNGSVIGNFAANGYAEHSPGGYGLVAALVTEVIMTFMFLIVILGATDERAPKGFAGIAIGLSLTLIHLDQYSGNQHFGEPGEKYQSGNICRRLGIVAVMAVHCRSYSRCNISRDCLQIYVQQINIKFKLLKFFRDLI